MATGHPSYFAFISHSGDLRAASWLQRTLEHFRYPRDSISEPRWPDNPTFVREIFLDKTSLSGRNEGFKTSLSEALRQSRYLIVLCSPRSAQKKSSPEATHWVEWEIETFRLHHGDSADARIIPVVLEGEPDESERSCLPRPIRLPEFRNRNIPDMRPENATVSWGKRQAARESAVITLLSYVFDVERSILRDRFALEKAKARARMALTGGVALGVAAALSVWGWAERRNAAFSASFRTLVEAQSSLDSSSLLRTAEAFSGAPDALRLFASRDASLPEAREWLANKLLERSWLVPVERHRMLPSEESYFAKPDPSVLFRPPSVDIPAGYPLRFEIGMGTIADSGQHLRCFCGTQQLWQSKESVFFVGDARVEPSGRLLLGIVFSPRHAIVALDPWTGRERWRTDTNGELRDWAPSPDGRLVALLRFGGDVAVLDAETGRRLFETFRAGPNATGVAFPPDGASLLLREGIADCSVLRCALLRNLADWRNGETGHPLPQNGILFPPGAQEGELAASIPPDSGGTTVRIAAPDGTGLFPMPDTIFALRFVKLGGKTRLMVAGGSAPGQGEERAFYAIIDPHDRILLRQKTGLGLKRFDTIEPIGPDRILLADTANGGSLVVQLPGSTDIGDPAGAVALARLLSGALPDGFPPETVLDIESRFAPDSPWRRFLGEALAEPSGRHVSFLSDLLNSDAVRPDVRSLASDARTYSPEQARLALSVRPDDPDAAADLWFPESLALAHRHREETEFADNDRETLSILRNLPRKSDEYALVAADPVALFFARFAVNRLSSRYPGTEAAEISAMKLSDIDCFAPTPK